MAKASWKMLRLALLDRRAYADALRAELAGRATAGAP